MKCDKIQNSILDYIEKNLSEKDMAEFTTHVNTCENCKAELTEMQEFLSVIPTDKEEYPSKGLRKNFEQILSEEKQLQEAKVVKLKSKINWKTYLRVAASVVLIISAYFLGKIQQNTSKINLVEIVDQQKFEDENKLLALIEDRSASKRIQAVSYSEKFEDGDKKIIQALINRLFFDKNTNVRLSAAESLSKFSSLEMVKSALIKALETDNDSSIQLELIQILAKIQEKRAIEPMKKLLNREDVPNYVKQELQYTISNLL